MSNGVLPPWSGFYATVEKEKEKSNIGFLPVINGSPTQVYVVTEILERSIRIADELHQEEIVVAMDEAVYTLAQRIRWQTPVMQKRIVLRLGEFTHV